MPLGSAVDFDGTIYITEAGIPYSHLIAINLDGTLRWACPIDDFLGEEANPAIGNDGTIYIGGWEWLSAVNRERALKWKYFAGGTYSTPAIDSDGTIYIGEWDNEFYAINSNGALKWCYEVEGEISGSCAIGADGTVYIGSHDNFIYALNPDGTLKWRYKTQGDIWSSPAIGSDGALYSVSEDGHLYAIQGSGVLANSPWPKFQHDNQNTGRVGGGR